MLSSRVDKALAKVPYTNKVIMFCHRYRRFSLPNGRVKVANTFYKRNINLEVLELLEEWVIELNN